MGDADGIEARFARSAAYNAEAAEVIPGSVNSNVRLMSYPFPICFERGEGAHLYDIDGNRYIDYTLGMGPAILGHAPGAVCAAVSRSLTTGQMLGGQTAAELDLARRLQRVIPSAERVRIGMTGTEVVQAALRVARAHTGRDMYVKFEGQYHGWLDNVLLSNAPDIDAADPRAAQLESRGQVASVKGDVIVLPWNDVDVLRAVLEADGTRIAAILTEPAMCNTGVIAPASGFLEEMRALATRHGVVLIFDEVITGFRLGIGGAQARFHVTPDLSTFAKAMASGFPVAALAGRAEIMDLFGRGVNHSGTYNANVPGIHAAIATLDILAADDGAVLGRIEATGTALMEGLREVSDELGAGLRVQGYGAAFSTFFAAPDHAVTDYRSYRRTDLDRQRRFLQALVPRGVRPTNRGTWFVSAAHGEADLRETVNAAREALRATG